MHVPLVSAKKKKKTWSDSWMSCLEGFTHQILSV